MRRALNEEEASAGGFNRDGFPEFRFAAGGLVFGRGRFALRFSLGRILLPGLRPARERLLLDGRLLFDGFRIVVLW